MDIETSAQTSTGGGSETAPTAGQEKISKLKSQVEEVKKVMVENVEKVIERGERLEDLMDKSEDLESNSNSFRQNTGRLRRHLCLRNLKWTITMVIVGTVVTAVIIVVILYETGVIKGKYQ